MQQWPSLLVVSIHMTALSALALTHPLLQLIGRDPEFLVVHQLGGRGVVAFVALMLLLIPAVAIALAWILRRLAPAASRWFVAVSVGASATALALQGTLGTPVVGTGFAALVVGAVAGMVAGVVYFRSAVARSFVTALSPAIVVVPTLFLMNPSIGRFFADGPVDSSAPRIETTTPVFVIVFDELPLASLLDEKATIDARHYPSFAALAADGMWFRNATTVATHTRWAIPALTTGKYPQAAAVPTDSWYPDNIFTLFGASHHMSVFEPMSRLCPASLCVRAGSSGLMRGVAIARDMAIVYMHLIVPQPWAAELPPLDEDWGNFGNAGGAMSQRAGWLGLPDVDERRAKPLEFIADLSVPTQKPGFWFMHVVLPHNPYLYLPSGQSYDGPRGTDPAMEEGGFWIDDETAVAQVYQRHLLQVGYADRFLGELIAKLKAIGVYDRVLLAVVSDHGVSFRPGDRRRTLTNTNRADILSVPFIIKAPSETDGRIIDDAVEAVDLLPTIAAMLSADIPWQVDGRAGVDSEEPRDVRRVLSLPPGNRLRDDLDKYSVQEVAWRFDLVEEAVRRKLILFEDGDPFKPQFLPEGDLVGQTVAGLAIGDVSNVTVNVNAQSQFQNVSMQNDRLPLRIHGTATVESAAPRSVTLAIAVNGTIRITTRVLPDGSWSALVPPQALQNGMNDVQMFIVSSAGALPRLSRPITARKAE